MKTRKSMQRNNQQQRKRLKVQSYQDDYLSSSSSSLINSTHLGLDGHQNSLTTTTTTTNAPLATSTTALQDGDFKIQQKDKVEKKVELIFKNAQNNNYNSLTIWGTGLDVERTIGVVEELKRMYVKQGNAYSQETSIKIGDNNEPHLQVILTMLSNNEDINNDTTNCDNAFVATNN